MVTIDFGSIILKIQGDVIWLELPDGESMGVDKEVIEKLLLEYYADNF